MVFGVIASGAWGTSIVCLAKSPVKELDTQKPSKQEMGQNSSCNLCEGRGQQNIQSNMQTRNKQQLLHGAANPTPTQPHLTPRCIAPSCCATPNCNTLRAPHATMPHSKFKPRVHSAQEGKESKTRPENKFLHPQAPAAPGLSSCCPHPPPCVCRGLLDILSILLFCPVPHLPPSL